MPENRFFVINMMGYLILPIPLVSLLVFEKAIGFFTCLLLIGLWGFALAISCFRCNHMMDYTNIVSLETEPKRHKINRIKITLFFFFLFFSVAIILAIVSSKSSAPIDLEAKSSLISGLCIGPILSFVFTKKKGIYNSCVFLIFLAETSLLCISLYSHVYFMPFLGIFALGMLISATAFLCPLLIYYLLGPALLFANLGKVLKISLWGLFVAFPLSHMESDHILSTQVTLITIMLLLGGFFTLFSAWRHRLVLLK